MIARSQIAVLYFNAGVGFKRAETKLGELRFKQQFQKLPNHWLQKDCVKETQNLTACSYHATYAFQFD